MSDEILEKAVFDLTVQLETAKKYGERLIRERDEAEAAGYRRGVEDAAKVGAEAASYGIWEHDMDRVERAILALLEPTDEPGEKK